MGHLMLRRTFLGVVTAAIGLFFGYKTCRPKEYVPWSARWWSYDSSWVKPGKCRLIFCIGDSITIRGKQCWLITWEWSNGMRFYDVCESFDAYRAYKALGTQRDIFSMHKWLSLNSHDQKHVEAVIFAKRIPMPRGIFRRSGWQISGRN